MSVSKSKDESKHGVVVAAQVVGGIAGTAATTAIAATVAPATYTTFAGVTFLATTAKGGLIATFIAANPVVLPVVGLAVGGMLAYKFTSWLTSDDE